MRPGHYSTLHVTVHIYNPFPSYCTTHHIEQVPAIASVVMNTGIVSDFDLSSFGIPLTGLPSTLLLSLLIRPTLSLLTLVTSCQNKQ
jgi:hypothetical protein